MTSAQKENIINICKSVQMNKYNDCSGLRSICKATKREILKAYKKIGKQPPGEYQPVMKIVKRKTA